MAGEIQIGGTTFAKESGGTVTVSNVDSATNRQNLGLEIGVDVQSFDADTTKNDVANTFTANQIISVTDTNAALRVTQLGTGNALVVEDSTNPDSTPFVIDASGNVLVGKTASNVATVGFEAKSDGAHFMTRDSGEPLKINRLTDDGNLIVFAKDGTTIGSIGVGSNNMFVDADGGNYGILRVAGQNRYTWYENAFYPEQDNLRDLGESSKRWNDAYIYNGVTTGSDANEKTEITTSELGLHFINKINPVSYKFIGRYRTHYGIISQEIETLLSDLGKTSMDFAGFIKSPVTDEDGNETGEYRYGLRYTEFISPMIKAIQEQQTQIESQQSQIDALTARIEALETV